MVRKTGDFHVDSDFEVNDQSQTGGTQQQQAPGTVDGFSDTPRVKAHDLTALTATEIAQLTQDGSDVASVRENLINANGGSRVLHPDHLSKLLTKLDTRTFEQKTLYTSLGGRNHPQQKLIDSLKQLNTEAINNANEIYAGRFPSLKEAGLISSKYKASAALLQDRLTNGTSDDIDELLKLGADPTETVRDQNALQLAFGNGTVDSLKTKVFKKMVTDRRSGMINQSLVNAPLRDGKNALHLMIEQGNVNGVKWLLSHGAYKKETTPQSNESRLAGLARVVTRKAAPKVEGQSPIDIANTLAEGEAKTKILALLRGVSVKDEPEEAGVVQKTDLPVTSSSEDESNVGGEPRGAAMSEPVQEHYQDPYYYQNKPWQTTTEVAFQDLRGIFGDPNDDVVRQGTHDDDFQRFFQHHVGQHTIKREERTTSSKPALSLEEQKAAENAEFEKLFADFVKNQQ